MHRGDDWLMRHLENAGVDLGFVQMTETPGGHAIVVVNAEGENQIILFPGANHQIDMTRAFVVLEQATAGDWVLIQNETNGAAEFVTAARRSEMKIAYAAAPFDAEVTLALLPQVDLLMVNAIEAAALMAATGGDENSLGVDHLVITRGSAGSPIAALPVSSASRRSLSMWWIPLGPVIVSAAIFWRRSTRVGMFLRR